MERISVNGDASKRKLELSRIIYGMWRLADDENRNVSHVQAKVEACLAQGITSFDQADIYGNYESERLFGQLLKEAPKLRDKIEIITKCDIKLMSDKSPERVVKYYDTSPMHITQSVDNSLKLMNVDHIDMLLLHRPDPLMNHHETGAALDALIGSGKIGSVGVSNFKPWDINLLQSAMSNPITSNQIEISLLTHEAFTNGDIAFAQEKNITLIAWSPLAGGGLFDPSHKSLLDKLSSIGAHQGYDASAVAVAWLLAHPAGILPVMGTNNIDRIAALGDACKVKIDRETWFVLYELALGHEVP
ncbi:aldo/keto reductase [Alphaproteobacteria bacterium]|nr:aldo/keto reductase [Alphaproteobacteria bacterium]